MRMNMFINVNSRLDNREIDLNMVNVLNYESKDVVDPDGSTHKCIIYTLTNGIKIEEEFDNDSDREAKLESLEAYNN